MKTTLHILCVVIPCFVIKLSVAAQFYNGDFNIGAENCTGPAGWTTNSDGVQISRLFNNNDNWLDITGCGSGNGRWIEQQVVLTPGKIYSIRMDLGTWSEWDDEDAGVDITIDGIPLGNRIFNNEFSQVKGWRLFWKRELRSCTFVAYKSKVTIRFTGNGKCTKTSPAFKCANPVPGVIALDNLFLDSVNINFLPQFCLFGGSTDLKFSFSLKITDPKVQWWYNGLMIGTDPVQKVYKDGTYTLKLFFECDSIILQTEVLSVKDENQSFKICEGDSLKLFNRFIKLAGTYYDTVKVGALCKKLVITDLSYLKVNTETGLSRQYYLCTLSKDSIVINAGNGYTSYLWYPGKERSSNITVKIPGNYSFVYKKDSLSCEDSIPFSVNDLCDPISFMPNAFTPDGDGYNDVFPPELNYVSDYHIYIYNRWGELLYTSNDPKKGWNGNYKNELCMEGVYMYIIDFWSNKTNQTYRFSGTITLLR